MPVRVPLMTRAGCLDSAGWCAALRLRMTLEGSRQASVKRGERDRSQPDGLGSPAFRLDAHLTHPCYPLPAAGPINMRRAR